MYNSYSKLLIDLKEKTIRSLELIPKRREVIVYYKNGGKRIIPVLSDDQLILRTAQVTDTPLLVNDYKNEEASARILSTFASILILLLGFSFLVRKAAKTLNSGFSPFGRSDTLVPKDKLKTRFDDVAGSSEALEELREIISFLKEPEKYENIGASLPKGVLLSGLPGTGKTLLARSIAGEANVPFYSISASEFVELFVGVGASRVRELFRKAKENSPSIIFIDEIDAIGRQRGAGIGIGNDEREQTLNQLITQLDGFDSNSGVVVLAATNRYDVLDSALTRPGRFDRNIELSLPDTKARIEILSIHSRSIPIADDISLKNWSLRTSSFSGADLKNLLNEAAICAARNKETIVCNNHIESAYDRITNGLSSNLLNNKNKLLAAYREVSKAMIAFLISYPERLDRISILPTTNSKLGVTRFLPTQDYLDNSLISKSYLKLKLKVLLAPRAGELVVYGNQEITQFSATELSQVHQIAKDMVVKYGFSTRGPLSIFKEEVNPFLGKSLLSSKSAYSQKTTSSIDKEIIHISKNALKDCIDMLSKRRNTLDKIVEILLDEETIIEKDFIRLLNKYSLEPIQ